MGLVRGRDTYVGVEIRLEDASASWGGISPSPHPNGGTWIGVPLIREDLNIQRDPLNETEEISQLGAREAFETGRLIAVGSITVRPRWDAKWFHMMLGNLGYETVWAGKWVDGTAGSDGELRTHLYTMNTTMPAALQFRVFKSGQSATNMREVFTGVLVSRMVWTQPQSNHAEVTFEFLAKDLTLESSSGTPAAADGSVICALRDLGRATSKLEVRTGGVSQTWATQPNMRSFTITVDRSMAFEDAPLNNIDQTEKPATTGQREVTVELEGAYEETAHSSTTHPYNNYVNNQESGFQAQYVSTSLIGSTDYYACRISVPRLTWTDASVPVDSGDTLTWTASGTAINGVPGSYYDANDFAYPTLGTDFKIAVSCSNADDLDLTGGTGATGATGGDKFTENDGVS